MENFRQIGQGACGSVWAVDRDGPAAALKLQLASTTRSVATDSEMHQRIEKSLSSHQDEADRLARVNIPRHRRLILAGDTAWWHAKRSRFPADQARCNVLITDRILPFDKTVRNKLIDLFCPEKLQESIRNNKKDQDCLIRPYLGRRTKESRPSGFRGFTLRNKNLTLDQMRDLKLPVNDYACIMAEALAIMLWEAKTDADDVEFVLAPTGPSTAGNGLDSELLGSHAVWALDFDCVKTIALDESGVDQAAKAFLKNDFYYPRPGNEDQDLWVLFSQHFCETSRMILGIKSDLPGLFIKLVEGLVAERKSRTGED